MEQVFQLMNELLKKSQEARQRKLRIRTYKVVPLTGTVGNFFFFLLFFSHQFLKVHVPFI